MKEDYIPWPVWSDDDLSNEILAESAPSTTSYQGPQTALLPSSLKVHQWKRFAEIENVNPVLYNPTGSPDLFTNNQHLFQSEFMTWFCSTLTILNYCHRVNDTQWQGWYHVYSAYKPGMESQSSPEARTDGKYTIRLFFMGFWRRFEVDDQVPINEKGLPLLPRTLDVTELWPMLLAKAVWQIASITAREEKELLDFNMFSCFTGWSLMSRSMVGLTPKQRWSLLTKYTPKFEQPDPPENHKMNEGESLIEIPGDKNEDKRNRKNVKGGKSNDNTGERNVLVRKKDPSIVTILYCLNHGTVSNISTDYPIYVESTCDVPEDETQIKIPLEGWKVHRWAPWAVTRGIIDPKEYFTPARRIFVFNLSTRSKAEWLDFNKLTNYPLQAYFLFKSEYFKYTINISNIFTDAVNQTRRRTEAIADKGGGAESRIMNEHFQIRNYLHSLKKSRNKSLYLFVDSADSTFFLVNYSVYGENRNGSLVIEGHCWFRKNMKRKKIVEVMTRGHVSRGVCLEPGRHVLRILCSSATSYYLTISSDMIFHIGTKEEIQNLMTCESERTKVLVNDIKLKLTTAIDSFGLPNYSMNLKNYYKSYMPAGRNYGRSRIMPRVLNVCFEEKIIEAIEQKCSKDLFFSMRRAFRIFFINPDIGKRHSEDLKSHSNDSTEVGRVFLNLRNSSIGECYEDPSCNDIMKNIAAVKIQSLFRMIRVKNILGIHRSNHRNYEEVKENLQNILELLDEETMCNVVRDFIHQNKELRGQYACAADFDKVLQIQKLNGVTSISSYQWILIIRKNLNVSNGEIVFAAIDMFIDLPAYILKVFDNDSEREIPRFIDNVMGFHYKENKKGYTLLGYGWSDNVKNEKLDWTVHLTTIKGSPQFEISNDSLSTSVEVVNPRIYELSNYYIPNTRNYITQLIFRVFENCNVSVKFQTSYENTRIKLQILDENFVMVREGIGRWGVLVPILNVDSTRKYWINVFVIEDSWPLTEAEWLAVEKAKKDLEDSLKMGKSQNLSSDALLNDPNQSTKSSTGQLAAPHWICQLLLEPAIDAELHQDTERELKILKMKSSWQLEDPNRLHRGKEMRKKFYKENSITHSDTESLEYDDVSSKTTLSSGTVTNEARRTLNPPHDYDKIPSFDFSSFMRDSDIKVLSPEETKRKKGKENLLNYQKKLKHLMHHLEMVMLSSLRVSTN